MGKTTLSVQEIPLERIRLDRRNPRTDGERDLDELAASLAGVGPVQLPIVLPDADGGYRVLVGERRVRAAKQAGLTAISCLVSDPLDPIAAHRARLAENLHRQPLNPIDHAQSLRVAWLLANAEAMELGREARALMEKDRPLSAILPELETLLEMHGFKPTAPAVTWEQTLDELGVDMTPARRKKLLRVLSMSSAAQETLRQLPVTEAATRALARLDEGDLLKVAEAIQENPDLARRARRMARAIYQQGYTPEEAIAEASGQFVTPEPEQEAAQATGFDSDQAARDAVLNFLDAANTLLAAMEGVRQVAPQTLDLPDPWRSYFQNALGAVRDAVNE
jgi:hypothetical protein